MYVHREYLSLTSVPLRRFIVSFSFSSFAWFFCQCLSLPPCLFVFSFSSSVSLFQGSVHCVSRLFFFFCHRRFVAVSLSSSMDFFSFCSFQCFSLPLLSYCPLLGQVLAHCRSCFVFSLLQAVDVGRFHRRAHVVHVPGGSRSAGLVYALCALNSPQRLFFFILCFFFFDASCTRAAWCFSPLVYIFVVCDLMPLVLWYLLS